MSSTARTDPNDLLTPTASTASSWFTTGTLEVDGVKET